MFKNYLAIAIRQLLKYKIYSLINLSGLAIGMACIILVFLYVQEELGYDEQHQSTDHIYKVVRKTQNNNSEIAFTELTSGALGEILQNNFPEIQQVTRTMRWNVWMSHQKNVFRQVICVADANFFNMFDFPLIQGDSKSVLLEPSGIVITQNMAQKYFGPENPLGKIISVETDMFKGDYKVNGILKDIVKSTLNFDCLISQESLHRHNGKKWWSNWIPLAEPYIETYLLISNPHATESLAHKASKILGNYLDKDITDRVSYQFQPFSKVYLYSNHDYGLEAGGFSGENKPKYGDIDNLYITCFSALFILLISCINFINLSTALGASRIREIGIRKTVGANRIQLISQFLGESLILSFFACLLALAIVLGLLPLFSILVEKNIPSYGLYQLPMILVLLSLVAVVSIASGSYTAFRLSAYQPSTALKNKFNLEFRNSFFRKGLFVFQFSLAILFLIITLVARNQIDFILNKDLGFNSNQVVILPIFSSARDSGLWGYAGVNLKKRYNDVKRAFLKHPDVLKSTSSRFALGSYTTTTTFFPEGMGKAAWHSRLLGIDESFLDFYEIDLISGINFSEEYAKLNAFERKQKGISEGFIINEAAVKQLGWDNPIGKQLESKTYGRGTIIGIVHNFNYRTLHETLEPVVMISEFRYAKYLHLKIRTQNWSELRFFLENTWQQFLPNRPFEVSFLTENLAQYYQTETRLERILRIFSLLNILVSCLGLFGLISFLAEQRKKEMSIRKVLGATLGNIATLLSWDIMRLVILANIIAWPCAFYFSHLWLRNFAYHIDVEISTFVYGGMLALIVALVTVSYHLFKAATENPINSLKNE